LCSLSAAIYLEPTKTFG